MFAPLTAGADDGPIAPGGSSGAESKIKDNVLTGVEATPNAYFVQFAGKSVSAGGSLNAIKAERNAFLADADEAGVEVEIRGEFDTLWNGLSVTADADSLTKLASSQVVTAIFPVGIIEAPDLPEGTIDPDLFTAIGMTGADIAQSELGFTGEGVKVGIIDTGVDIDHPALGGGGTPGSTAFPSERVPLGYDFVGDDYNADPSGPTYQPKPFPDENPDDCQGHGTHVAGIVGADGGEGGIKGVAPGVTFGAYRVFGCGGSTESDIMLHAMEKSLDDGMDVVNLSIGSAFSSWAEYPTSQATDALAREGVIVVASIGNEGDMGLHAAGSPGVGLDTIGVGSVDNVAYMSSMFLDKNDEEIPYVEADAAPAPTSGTVDAVAVAAPGTPTAIACGTDPFTAEEKAAIAGNWVLIQRGTCSFYEKSYNGQQAGAAGVILYNNAPGVINPTVAGDPPVTVPVVMISNSDGAALVSDAMANGSTPITWTAETTSAPNPTGGLMSGFSSYGTSADMRVKPDLAAPGGSIYSTYPLEKAPYASLSGTSMASPHVAGAAALMLEADPTLTPGQTKEKLQNSAKPLPFNLAPAAGLDVVHKQGAGMIHVDKAIEADVELTPGMIQLGQQLPGVSSTHSVTLTNSGDAEKTFAVGSETSVATYGTANDFYYDYADADVSVSADSVTVPAGGTATVDVTITSPAADEDGMGAIFGGYVTFTADEESYAVTFGGSANDLQTVEVLADMVNEDGSTALELPVLAQLESCAYFLGIDCVDEDGSWDIFPEGGATFTMVDGDVPSVAIHFEHQARKMVWTAYAANADGTKGEALGVVSELDYLSKSGTRNGIGVWTWDGKTVGANGAREDVASGDYIIEIDVTKASAFNDDREAGVETWTSPAFTIDRGDVSEGPVVERAFGPHRYGTAAELAIENFDAGVDTVYIASGVTFPDALSGGALAGTDEAPILLVKPDSVPGSTRMALQTLAPKNIVIFGGEEAIDADVEAVLSEYADVSRLAGAERYSTSVAVSQAFAQPGADLVFLATGLDYADALSASAVAGHEGAPVLLAKKDGIPASVRAELDRLSPAKVVVLGGGEALSTKVVNQARGHADSVQRIAGANRYSTAAKVADAFFDAPTQHAMLASGEEFPDALTTGPVAAKYQTPVLLSKAANLPAVTLEQIMDLEVQKITIVGGYEAISEAIQEQLEAVTYP